MEQRFLNDAQIKGYLLGNASQEEQERIEQRLLVDAEFREILSMTRTDVVDDYVAASLSPTEREQFEQYFLSTPEHRQMLAIARALAQRFERDAQGQAATANALSPVPTSYNIRHLNAIISITAGLALLVTGYVIWEIVKHRYTNDRMNEAREQRATLENEIAKLNHPAAGSGQNAFAVVTLNLKPVLVRDLSENRSVAISKDPRVLQLRLELPTDKSQSYQASLQTNEGVELAVIHPLARTPDNGPVVLLDLPSWLMRPGSYQVKLRGMSPSGVYEDVGLYPFEMTN